MTVSLANPASNTGDAAGDTYVSIEGLQGGDFNDSLTGDGFTNNLIGSDGADTLNGGAGIDYAGYNEGDAEVGVFANLANPGSNTGRAQGDVYVGIEGLIGSRENDTLIGGTGGDYLSGGRGADSLNGGGAFDYATYVFADGAVRASLVASAGNTGEAAGDSYALIEGLIGSNFNDALAGNGGANLLAGGLGRDTLNGGAGADGFVFDKALNPTTNVDTVESFSHPEDTIRLSKAVFSAIVGAANTILTAGQFALSSQAAQADDRVIYNAGTGELFYDADGGARTNAVLFADVANPATAGVAFNDFLLIA